MALFPSLSILEESFSEYFAKILGNSPHTRRACTCTRVNTGKHSWRIIYVLASCQGVNVSIAAWPLFQQVGRGLADLLPTLDLGHIICPKATTLEHLIFGQFVSGKRYYLKAIIPRRLHKKRVMGTTIIHKIPSVPELLH